MVPMSRFVFLAFTSAALALSCTPPPPALSNFSAQAPNWSLLGYRSEDELLYSALGAPAFSLCDDQQSSCAQHGYPVPFDSSSRANVLSR